MILWNLRGSGFKPKATPSCGTDVLDVCLFAIFGFFIFLTSTDFLQACYCTFSMLVNLSTNLNSWDRICLFISA